MARILHNLVVSFVCLLSFAFAQTSYCDPLAKPSRESPYPYQMVDGRCEGKVAELASSVRLELISFTDSFEAVALDEKDFELSWDAVDMPADLQARLEEIHLSVRPAQLDCLYQMDTRRPTSTTTYSWSTRLAKNSGIRSTADLGVVAYSTGQENILLPLRFGTESLEASDRYTFTIRPNSRVEEFLVTLVQLSADGNPVQALLDKQPYQSGPFPAFAPVKFEFEKAMFPASGLYELTISGKVSGIQELPTTSPLHFFHFGR
jgi:hypothetical protein